MNDFTKEELEQILFDLDIKIFTFGEEHIGDFYLKLREKTQFMIDNYKCNHESDGMCYTSNPPKNKCKKCGKFYR